MATGLGAPRRRRLSIPQGCPWSNALLGLLLRPLLLMLRSQNVIPKLLADDLEAMAFGHRHAARLGKAQRCIEDFLGTM